MQLIKTSITGCYELIPIINQDERGNFIKIFNEETFSHLQLETKFTEEFYSLSKKNVLRGLHFQVPPKDHVKLVYCICGEVIDVLLDLRIGSPTYGKFELFNMNSIKANILYIPSGLAHGFYVLSETAILVYKTSCVYSAPQDTGILWSSANIPWPCNTPIVSNRDKGFISLSEFNSPFIYES